MLIFLPFTAFTATSVKHNNAVFLNLLLWVHWTLSQTCSKVAFRWFFALFFFLFQRWLSRILAIVTCRAVSQEELLGVSRCLLTPPPPLLLSLRKKRWHWASGQKDQIDSSSYLFVLFIRCSSGVFVFIYETSETSGLSWRHKVKGELQFPPS